MRRLLTMSNLFENLACVYGDREVLDLAEPLGYRLLPTGAMSSRDCLRFTNLAAEAIIRDLDLKKGERVLTIIPNRDGLMLVATALMKAGGVVVPVGSGLPAGEIESRARGCGATLAVVEGSILAERPELRNIPGIERVVVSGPRSGAPDDVSSLDEAMDVSSGFFLPYTLKPGNVVALFHTRMRDGTLKAVMATNEALLGPHLRAAPLLPSRPGDLCMHAMELETMAGFHAAVLGLCMGLRMRFVAETEPQDLVEIIGAERPRVFMATSEAYPAMLAAGAANRDLSSVRLWFAAGEPLPRCVTDEFRSFARPRQGALRTPACFIEAYGAEGNAIALALKPALRCLAGEGSPGFIIPPNRVRIVDREGRPVKHAGEGTLEIRGPAVTPGYWNDVEGTLGAKRDGWLHTGIRAAKGRCLIVLK
jgi:acyl-coenzyme A synthetase/AMP-(fatty) acid ligase